MHATHKPLSLQLVCHQGNNSVVKITDLFCIVHIWTSCVDTKMLYSCTLMQSSKRLLHYHTTSSHVLLFAVRVLKKGAWNYSWQCFSWGGPVLNGTLAHSLCSSLSMISGWSVADFKFLGFVEYGGRGSWCWHCVGGCGVGVNTMLGQGGCIVLSHVNGWMQVVMWPLQVPDEEGCSPSHLRHTWAYLHLKALGHAEWLNCRQMVRPSSVLLLTQKEERLPAWGTGCRSVAIFGAFGAEWLGVCRTP